MLDIKPCNFRDHLHIWVWLSPIRMDNTGQVRWACRKCAHVISRDVGVIPGADED